MNHLFRAFEVRGYENRGRIASSCIYLYSTTNRQVSRCWWVSLFISWSRFRFMKEPARNERTAEQRCFTARPPNQEKSAKRRLFGSCTQGSSRIRPRACFIVRPPHLSVSPSHAQSPAQQSSIATKGEVNLQGVSEQLVHLGKLGRDAEVDCPVANLDDEATDDIGVDLSGISTGHP